MEDLLIRKNLRWTGHLLRMPTDRPSETDSLLAATRRHNDHVAAHVSATKTQSRET